METKLNDEQQAAIDAVKEKSDITIITGAAGTGKSFLIDEMKKQVRCIVTATTGAAAANIAGATLDSVVKLNRSKPDKPRGSMPWYDQHMRRLPAVIVIDEASMIGCDMMNYLVDWVVRRHKKRLVLVGDWAQAAPVKDDWVLASKLFVEEDDQLGLPIDELSVTKIKLKHNFRQADDSGMLDILNRMRHGAITPEDNAAIAARVGFRAPTAQEFIDGANCTCLFGINDRADALNAQVNAQLRLSGVKAVRLNSRLSSGMVPAHVAAAGYINGARLKNSPLAHGIELAETSRIMITRNDPETGLVNGDMGRLIEIGEDELIIKADRFEDQIVVEEVKIEVDSGSDSYTVEGFPIRAAYGLTVHKAQGQTLEHVFIDMESFVPFANHEGDALHGLVYVALSRCKSLDGIFLNRWEPEFIHCAETIRPLIA